MFVHFCLPRAYVVLLSSCVPWEIQSDPIIPLFFFISPSLRVANNNVGHSLVLCLTILEWRVWLAYTYFVLYLTAVDLIL